MKKCIVFFAFLLLIGSASAQYSLQFCETVTKEGTPQRASNAFILGSHGGGLSLFVSTESTFSSDQLRFTIYYINAEGNEEEVSALSQKIEPGWDYAWKEVMFFNSGTYRVKVYGGTGSYLTSANVSVKLAEK